MWSSVLAPTMAAATWPSRLTWSERGTILGDQRRFSEIPLWATSDGTHVPFGASFIPGTRIGIQPANFSQINGIDLSNADGACPGTNDGVRFDAGGQPVPYCWENDKFNYAADNYLLRPIERYQISVIGSHEFNERVEAYAQAFYVNYQQDYQMAPLAVAPTSFGQPNGTVIIPDAANNPLFSPALQNFWAQNANYWDADGDGNYTVSALGRRFEEFGPRHFDFNTDAWLMTTGLRGSFDVGDNNWTWDAFYQYSQNESVWTLAGVLSRSASHARPRLRGQCGRQCLLSRRGARLRAGEHLRHGCADTGDGRLPEDG